MTNLKEQNGRQIILCNSSINLKNTKNSLLRLIEKHHLQAVLLDKTTQKNNLIKHLGTETDILIVDLQYEQDSKQIYFNPRLYAALVDSIRKNGLLIFILNTKLEQLQNFANGCFGFFKQKGKNYYFSYLQQCLSTTQASFHNFAEIETAIALMQNLNQKQQKIKETQKQKHLLDKIHKKLNLLECKILVTGNRGTGKSTTIGLLIAKLIKSVSYHKIVLTANYLPAANKALQVLKYLLQAQIPNEHIQFKKNRIILRIAHSEKEIIFRPVDYLLNFAKFAQPKLNPDLLLVEEAAQINIKYLHKLAKYTKKVIFITTTQGFEGSGMGFNLIFKDWLKLEYSNYSEFSLEKILRWHQKDKVEQLNYKLLHLEYICFSSIKYKTKINQLLEKIRFRVLSKHQLISINKSNDNFKTKSLSQVLSLLATSHYKFDQLLLLSLLSDPRQKIYLAYYKNNIVAVCLLQKEYQQTNQSFQKDPLIGTINNLFLKHKKIINLPKYIYRITRIAVLPSLQNQGIGTKLLQYVLDNQSRKNNLIGTIFSAKLENINFWKKNSFKPIEVSNRPNKHSGYYSLAMIYDDNCSNNKNKNINNWNFFNKLSSQAMDKLISYKQ